MHPARSELPELEAPLAVGADAERPGAGERDEVEAPGFAPARREAATGEPLEIRLEPAIVVETVTVNAGTLDQARLDDPVASTAIGRADIVTRNNRRLADVVARMPGVLLTGPPGGDKDVRLRGLDKEFTRTEIDGVTIPDGGEKGELQLNRIPSSVLETVRIVRNPTAEFESDGLAGRVVVETRPVPDRFHLEGRFGSGARSRWTDDITHGRLAGGSRLGRRLGVFAAYDYLADTLPIERERLWSSGASEREEERQRQRSGNFFGEVAADFGSAGSLHFKPVLLGFLTDMNRLREARSSGGAPASRESEAEEKSPQTRGAGLHYRLARPSGRLWDTRLAWFSSTEGKDKWRQAFRADPSGLFQPDKRTLEPESKADRTWNFATAASIPLSPGFRHELKFGGALRRRSRFRNKDRTEIDRAGTAKSAGTAKDRYRLEEDYEAAFLQSTLRPLRRFSLTPGLRLERLGLAAATPAERASPRQFLDLNPSLHLLYRLEDRVSFRWAVSRVLARPKFDELAPYEVETATKVVLGNPDLEPARAWSFDGGIEVATPGLSLAANAFYKQVRGVIEEVDTGLDRGTRNVFQVRNTGDGWVRGLEFEQRLRLAAPVPRRAGAVSLWANQTLLRSRLRQADGLVRPFKEQPRWIANFGADWHHEAAGTALSVMANLVSRRYDYKPAGDVAAKRGWAGFDAAFYQRLRGAWRLFVEINNLTNRDRTEDEMLPNGAGSRRREHFGRTFLAGLQFGW